MGVHGPAQVEQQVLGDLADDGLLDMVGGVIDGNDGDKYHGHGVDHGARRVLGDQGVVDHRANDQRDRKLGNREHQHRADSNVEFAPIRLEIFDEAPRHPFVENLAEQLLVIGNLRADHGQGRI